MFSESQKREISNQVQRILRATEHPDLPTGEIIFSLYVMGEKDRSWAYIKNNGAVSDLDVNPHNENMDQA